MFFLGQMHTRYIFLLYVKLPPCEKNKTKMYKNYPFDREQLPET